MTTDELIKAVEQWGKDKGIDNPYTQMVKVTEEVGEIAHEISRARFDSDELCDAFGDTLVTLIILANICDLDLIECLRSAYDVIKDRTGHIENGGFIKDEN